MELKEVGTSDLIQSATSKPNASFSSESIDTFAVTEVAPVFIFSRQIIWFKALSKQAV